MRVKGIDKEITGILFDMDGLLINSENLYWQANIQAAQEAGLNMPDDTYLKLVGSTTNDMQDFYHRYFKNQDQKQQFIDRTNELVKQWSQEGQLKLRSGVQAALDTFQKLGLPMAVVSSNDEAVIEYDLWQTGIRNYFKFHLNYDDVKREQLKPKPAPDIYLWAAKKMHVPKENILAFEDSGTGLAAAKNAGLKCVMVPDLLPATEVDQKNAVFICDDFFEFLQKI
ncbi:HAD family phosphatase [Lactobacillus sp. ESL0684]|uniref:HAD family hydrolase n=1 Tax=Lactobacillus sp. ESL0684 TaxID=2983213 RepID=UPI0023F87B71|nr:HAD family phosphatase [Lactobacillus sp. ESL0684]WEV42906.1 HAD family phosphatase [Lactobacillus sp. ESL0684]